MPTPGRPQARTGAARPIVAACLVASVAALAGCGAGQGEARTVDDVERGVRYVVPEGWRVIDGEARSRHGSLLTFRSYDLEGADSQFVAGLPDSVAPQLEDWARQYYMVEGPAARGETTVGGLPATVLTYPVRVRAADPLSKVRYWVVRKEKRLFVLRYVHPPDAPQADEASLQSLLTSLSFL